MLPKKTSPKPPTNAIPLKSQVNLSASIMSGKGNFVEKYTTSLNEMAQRGEIDDIIGRENELKEIVKDCMLEFMGSQRVGHDLVTEQQQLYVLERLFL